MILTFSVWIIRGLHNSTLAFHPTHLSAIMATSKLADIRTYKGYKVFEVMIKRDPEFFVRFIVEEKDHQAWRREGFVNEIEEIGASQTLTFGFGMCFHIHYSISKKKMVVNQEAWPDLIETLPKASLFNKTPSEAISMTHLSDRNSAAGYRTGRTALVGYNGELYMAKGPEDTHDVRRFVKEYRILHSLDHPLIIPPPQHVIKPSDTSDRIIAYLLKYYPKGNLREYALQLRSQDVARLDVLQKWAIQMAQVLHHLLYTCDHRYGNVKPENIVVDDNENLIMIDFGDTTACNIYSRAPEIYFRLCVSRSSSSGTTELYYGRTVRDRKEGDSIPEGWPPRAHENAIVYSFGRTLWMIWEATQANQFPEKSPSLDITEATPADQSPEKFRPLHCTNFTEATAGVPLPWKDKILQCVKVDPNERPTLQEIITFFKNAEEPIACRVKRRRRKGPDKTPDKTLSVRRLVWPSSGYLPSDMLMWTGISKLALEKSPTDVEGCDKRGV